MRPARHTTAALSYPGKLPETPGMLLSGGLRPPDLRPGALGPHRGPESRRGRRGDFRYA
jgi:hypothetical protein